MNDKLHNQAEEVGVDEDVARVRRDLKMGRFTLDFEGMDTITVLKRAEFVRGGLCEERVKRPENATKLISEIDEEVNREDFLPNVHFICEKLTARAAVRYESAKSAYSSALADSNVRPGPKAASIRRAIDEKYDSATAKRLSDERKKIDAQKKQMEKYIRMAPESVYAAMIKDTLSKNEESYRLAQSYLEAHATVAKYEAYAKNGSLAEEEKKLCALAKEVEAAAQLRLTDHKQSVYILTERAAAFRVYNDKLMREAHSKAMSCEKGSLAFLAIPSEMTERLLDHALTEKENRYYDLLEAKEKLTGFHPFKKMALNREIKKTAKAYSAGLALLPDTSEDRKKHSPLTDLAARRAKTVIQAEKVEDITAELIDGIPNEIMVEEPIEEAVEVKQPVRLDLGDKIHKNKIEPEPVFEKETKKDVLEIAEKDI